MPQLLAGHSIHQETGGRGVGSAVVGVEAKAGIATIGGQGTVIARIGDRYRRTGLSVGAIPYTGQGLISGEGPRQDPAINGTGTLVGDGDRARES